MLKLAFKAPVHPYKNKKYTGVETATGKSYMKPNRERTTNDFCEHWYYSQASYKGDNELLGYQPCEEGEGRDLNNDNSGACCRSESALSNLSLIHI